MKSIVSAMLSLLALILAMALVPIASAQSGNAKVRVIHASPDAPAVDVYVDGSKVLSSVPFFAVSDYLDVPAGEHRFQVTAAGGSPDDAVIDATATVDAGIAYTVAATGNLAEIQPTIIVDDMSAPASGKAKVRVYHFSPDAPAVDVKLKDGATLIPGLAFPNASDYLEVDAGSYDIVVTPAGGDAVVIDLSGTTLEAGNTYEVFATNELASITPELKVTAGSSAPAPTTLPTTSNGNEVTLPWLVIGALLLVGVGAAAMIRQRVLR